MRNRVGLVGVLLLLVPIGVVVGGTPAGATGPTPATCGGSVASPQALAGGTYSSLDVTGVCDISAGDVTVTGDVTVASGAALVSAWALDDGVPATTSDLTVKGNLTAGSGASLILGCEPGNFICYDDPAIATGPGTLSSVTTVAGSLTTTGALGVILHRSSIGGDLVMAGGGCGQTCATPSPANVFYYIPAINFTARKVYSDVEDTSVGGDLSITDLASNWFGALRNTVGGSATFSDITLADPDGNEIVHNLSVGGNLICENDSPAVQFGDSGQSEATPVGGYGAGQCAFNRRVLYPGFTPPLYLPVAVAAPGSGGYWLVASDGGIFSYGRPYYGSSAGSSSATAAMAATPGGTGYQLVTSAGAVSAFGPRSACSGSIPAPNRPIVGMAAVPGGGGCWTVASDGGIFTYGGAPFYGSAGSLPLNRPIVGMASAPGGNGYWLVASDGGIFSYGSGATFQGSMGGQHLNEPIVGMASDPATGGYWLVASDGGIFAFGAPFLGSMGGRHLNAPIVGMAAAPDGNGYYLVASDGGIFAFGSAPFHGSAGSIPLAKPIVGMAVG
jgi:hypothetical protein